MENGCEIALNRESDNVQMRNSAGMEERRDGESDQKHNVNQGGCGSKKGELERIEKWRRERASTKVQ